ncbi:MAG TPA: glycine cleavage T C-terminal barrel domain-containing protein, partial [Bryobacterales bacterium]|nr:glycine cleavage T C-terminal barrel domain-containing protein [Bryobacterales bacterium]
IRATGRDRVRFLHNLLSNDVKGLRPGQGNYHFLLNPQGRIQGDVNLYLFDDHILLDTEPEMRERVRAHLQKYIIADQVTLEDVTADLATVAVEGPQADGVAGVSLPAESGAHIEADGITAGRTSATGQPGVWFFVEAARKAGIIARLERAGAVAAAAEDARIVRVENALPRYGEDITDTILPQETQQARAVSFTKGCYLGQEIVERIRSRGQVHRSLVQLAIEGQEPPAAGSAILAVGQEIGKLTSPVWSPRQERCLGLAIVRRELAPPGAAVTIAGRAAQVLR